MKILILTGNRLRHLYFAKKVLEVFNDAAIVMEDFKDTTGDNYTNGGTTPLMAEHFREFGNVERDFFETKVAEATQLIKNRTMLHVAPDTINESQSVGKIIDAQPDLIVVYSTSILKQEIIEAFPNQIFNLHAGLSPYYRGGGTNFFPFYNRELEYVGMTVHYLDAGIDSGNIILQGALDFGLNDNTHTAGCKCVDLGAKLMIRAITRYLENKDSLPSVKQDLTKGRVYYKKHFSDESIIRVRENLSNGVVAKFLENPKRCDIVSW